MSNTGGAVPAREEATLEVRDLHVTFDSDGGDVHAVRGVDFNIAPGEIVALVGESGSGKSTIGLSLMRLIEQDWPVRARGEVWFRGKDDARCDLMRLPEREVQRLRGNDIAMVFQEPMSSLDPIFTIGSQITEAIRIHQDRGKREALQLALEMVGLLGIPNPENCLASYPHQISGGMTQRVMIAMAIACQPSLLIADEPTTGLDVTIQAQIIEHLVGLQKRTGMAILFITHDLGLVAEVADRVLVLYAGQVVELCSVDKLFAAPLMPYTRSLIASLPRVGCSADPDYRIRAIPGNVPSALTFPGGCAFHPRCSEFRASLCDAAVPPLESAQPGHLVRCFRWQEVQQQEARR